MPPLKFSSINVLEENPTDVYLESVEILIRIAKNVLKEPSNEKFRSISLKSNVVSSKLLPTIGAMECLFDMGFQEGEDNLVLPLQTSLESLRYIYEVLVKKIEEKKRKLTNVSSSSVACRRNGSLKIRDELVTLQNSMNNSFLRKAIFWCFCVLKYDNLRLQKKALSLIPLADLNLKVMKYIRRIQLEFKRKKIKEESIDYQELLLRELSNWFNSEFFTWVDTPKCTNCGFIETVHDGMSYSVIPGADRVEKYKCLKCNASVLFPRYNDVEKLLETRKGRCGEWANCFCLFCFALGWDSRIVFDESDHVWTEIYSVVQSRWIHCDPCENAVDTPLMYECGWKKKLSYIIAYSLDEIQDVTWRYSQNHGEVLQRRSKCSERELMEFIVNIRNIMLNYRTPARKKFVLKRTVLELVELMKENSVKESEERGRTSGSLSWRLLRGEIEGTRESKRVPYVWKINEYPAKDGKFELSYITSKDVYLVNSEIAKVNWTSGVYRLDSVFKNDERDWKMTYLARKEGAEKGLVSWKFATSHGFAIQNVSLKLACKTFESGVVTCRLSSETSTIDVPSDNEPFATDAFSGCTTLELVVELSGGHFWQHAQIFRQPFGSEESMFQMVVAFSKT